MSAIITETEITMSERGDSSSPAARRKFWRTLLWLLGLRRAP